MKSSSANSHSFIQVVDQLSETINHHANALYSDLKNLDPQKLNIDESFRQYFVNHHLGNRLFFSIQNSCHILYQSVIKTKKPLTAITLVDYGAGLGTLFMLAGKLGFKKTIYNDYLPEWKETAEQICKTLQIKIDAFVTGDIEEVIAYAEKNTFRYDIFASRNVIEHLYRLDKFYTLVHNHHENAVIFSTTTANYHNPAMWLIHYFLHKKIEKKVHLPARMEAISKRLPELPRNQLLELAKLTRGRAGHDFETAIQDYQNNKSIELPDFIHSNTCDFNTGYWSERILKKKEHAFFAKQAGFIFECTPGYWDTHYNSVWKNGAAFIFNRLIRILDNQGIVLSPFINLIACGRSN